MDILKRHHEIDLSAFQGSDEDRPALFGLPNDVQYCKRCVIPNQRPNSSKEYAHKGTSQHTTIIFDEEGVCDACRVAEMKKTTIDWDAREAELQALSDRYRRSDGSYDVLVPGSGGKDSFVVAHLLKYKYGMNPLTVTWAPHMYTTWGWENFEAWMHSGFDNYLMTPNGKVHRLLTRLATENMFHPFQAFTIGQKGFPVKMAMQFDIELIFYGDHPAEWGMPKEQFFDPQVHWDVFAAEEGQNVHLGGVSVSDLVSQFGITENELLPYMPFDNSAAQKRNIEFHCMAYYRKWHMQGNYYYAAETGGFQAAPERNAGSYSKYASIDDKMDDFNFHTTLIKFGFGRASTDASQEIRMDDISRDEGIALVRRYDGEFPERFSNDFFNYISLPEKDFPKAAKMFEQPLMDREYFADMTNRFRSPHLWNYANGAWSLRQPIWDEASE